MDTASKKTKMEGKRRQQDRGCIQRSPMRERTILQGSRNRTTTGRQKKILSHIELGEAVHEAKCEEVTCGTNDAREITGAAEKTSWAGVAACKRARILQKSVLGFLDTRNSTGKEIRDSR